MNQHLDLDAFQAASDGWKLIHVQSFLSILDRSDWRTAKNRAELRAMIAAPDSTPTDSAGDA